MITFRRFHLDKMLSQTHFYGRVLDIGGKKENKKGDFRPPQKNVASWEYLNIDQTTSPDYLCSCEKIPVEDESFDMVLLTAVLEHLEKPEAALKEAHRVWKRNDQIITTMPFLYPIHSDPCDYQRWTPMKIELEFKEAGLSEVKIRTMGGFFAVVYDLLYASIGIASRNRCSLKNRFARKFVMPVLAKIFMHLDKIFMYKSEKITTGFYITAIK
jgi:SAM-dependent methyltransferase